MRQIPILSSELDDHSCSYVGNNWALAKYSTTKIVMKLEISYDSADSADGANIFDSVGNYDKWSTNLKSGPDRALGIGAST